MTQTMLPEIAGRTPGSIYVPETMEELRELLRDASDETLVPAAGRTQLGLGNAPSGRFALLDLDQALPTDIDHQPQDLTVEAGAGATLGELQAQLAAHNQWLPLDPPLAEDATIGGTLASGAYGPLRGRFGAPRDFLLGATVLRADGESVHAGGRVVKNVTGYDMMRLWCGSLGTLGIFTHVALRVYPIQASTRCAYSVDGPSKAVEFAGKLARADVRPEVCETYFDGTTWRVFVQFPAPAEDTMAGLAAGLRESGEDRGSLYMAIRDLGFGNGDALTVRAVTLPADLSAAAAELAAAGPAAMSVGLVSNMIRASWSAAATPPVEDLNQIREGIAGRGGHLVVERMPSSVRADVDAWGTPPETLEIMERIKREYDPAGRLNRGRFVGRI